MLMIFANNRHDTVTSRVPNLLRFDIGKETVLHDYKSCNSEQIQFWKNSCITVKQTQLYKSHYKNYFHVINI